MLAAQESGWTYAESLIAGAEHLELREVRTVAERHRSRQFYEWVRQAHVTTQQVAAGSLTQHQL